MTLNDCFALDNTSPIYLRKNLTSFSLYGMIVSECELLQCQIKSVFLGEKGSNLFLESLEKICAILCELLSLNKDLNIEDRSESLSLASEFGITVNNTSLSGPDS